MSSATSGLGASMDVIDWIRGDHLGLEIPAHSGALRGGGEAFLTTAFRETGYLDSDNRVTRITRFEDCPGGSTGRKLLLSVEYERPAPHLHADLFVKFSRAFDEPYRDRARIQMESEVRFALLSRMSGFPIAVPTCCYADYHEQSGTGILIAQCIAFDAAGVERHYEKSKDYEVPEPLEHYKALIRALARLAAAHKAGRLSERLDQQFPFDPNKLTVSARAPYTAEQLQRRVDKYASFAAEFPHLLPSHLADPAFIVRLKSEVEQFPAHETAIKQFLQSERDLIALCHWNAHIDNAWFWRNSSGELECGLMDWGNASQMNLAMAIWGCLSAAELNIWNDHLDELLGLFVTELHAHGGPALDLQELTLHLDLYVAQMGLAWMLDAPHLIRAELPNLAQARDRFDEQFQHNERARNQLQIMTSFLNLWQRHEFGSLIERFLQRTRGAKFS
jgi:hypothetical protein